MSNRVLPFPSRRDASNEGHGSLIVLVEDNDTLASGLANNLEIEGYRVTVAATAATGLEEIRRLHPDLVILDLMLPDGDGYQVLSQLRREDNAVGVVILTARSEDADKVAGFRYGADDYVTKPFALMELLGRIKALLRRTSKTGAAAQPSDETINAGDLQISLSRHMVHRRGLPVVLRPKEFELLVAIARRRGLVVTKRDLLREVWGYNEGVLSRTVDTHVAELRRKLEDDAGKPRYIVTVRKTGYRLVGDE